LHAIFGAVGAPEKIFYPEFSRAAGKLHPGVEIFSDDNCSKLIADAKGVILETTSPGGMMKSIRVFPSIRAHFQKGKRVAWEWNMQRVWSDAWYRDPETGITTQAWVSSAEFIGRHLDEV
jgi:hypothetical protein